MSTLVNWNGQQYLVPAYNDTGYAQGNGNLSQYLVAISTGSLQQVGGLFQLTADADFGPNFGLVSSYYKSRSANIASAGVLRLANTDAIKWRNSDNSADVTLAMNATGTAARTYTIPDLATSSFVMTEGDQTINGAKTISDLRGTMGANLAAGGFKLTGLAAGSGNGDSLRYEQLIDVYLPLAGGTLTGTISATGGISNDNLISDGDFDFWTAGTPITGIGKFITPNWYLSSTMGGTYSTAKDTSNTHLSASCLACTVTSPTGGGSTSLYFIQDLTPADNFAGQTISVSAWVKTSVAGFKIGLYDGITFTEGSGHTGSGNYEYLTVTFTAGSAPSFSAIRLSLGWSAGEVTSTTTFYIDQVMAVFGALPVTYNAENQHIAGLKAGYFNQSLGYLFGSDKLRTSVGGTDIPRVQIEGLDFNGSSMMLTRNSANANCGALILNKSRGTVNGAVTAVNDGDLLGEVIFAGTDGTGVITGARIRAAVDGTPGTNDIPTKIDFMASPDGSATPILGARLAPSGTSVALEVKGAATDSNAAAGWVGEYIYSTFSSVLDGGSGVYESFSSVSLTAGDWDVSAICELRANTSASGTALTQKDLNELLINTTVDSSSNPIGQRHQFRWWSSVNYNNQIFDTMELTPQRISIASTTTVYITGMYTFSSTGRITTSGRIRARRVR